MFSRELKNIHRQFKEGKISKNEEKQAISILMKYEMRILKNKERAHTYHFMF